MKDFDFIEKEFESGRQGQEPLIEENTSKVERIVKIKLPDGSTRYSHQYWDGNNWKLCPKCGDLYGTPESSCGGGWPKVADIRKGCSKYRGY